ncbi:DUF1501 domain-containing protein [Singulisphaera acidiphila]|uniref:DUF1501 domain-containing protein n=1 Tax=Singulisphaera acidiphila (strain ATCC BAA-1392 / DSM 18658 / VKM B-2454 / MOB10) TaxID=886293 RepID=L0DP25_SINAD|nr:DUF1501 domain-containing protein [Singulisphaera acidiphila]AGA30570.1 hypothetical protein Sinac_6494 [Singulisphaera acidiphila DSM 18658]
MSEEHELGSPPSLSLERRRLLLSGGLGMLGLNLASRLRAAAPAPDHRPSTPIRSCILIFYYGGPSHLDTWDMKPNAPKEVRGEFRSIATRMPGIRISEHLPHSARVVDRLAIVRSLHHPMTNHNAAAFAALSGRSPAKGDLELLANDRNDPPCLGSVLSHELPERRGLPTFVALPHVMHNVVKLPGQVAGFLGSAHDPFQVASDPNAPDFRLDELELPGNVSLDRLGHRESMLRQVETTARSHDLDAYREKAVRLLHSDAVRGAFRLTQEDPKLRDHYGRTKHGQSLLLARRLVESGVRFITVNDHETNGQVTNWDAHQDVFPRLRNDLLPPTDRAFAALIDDLTSRGLLESTLVIALGEFGRTPKINVQGGRDHWPHCYSAVLAGGGVRGGTVYGASDKLGAYPDLDGVSPGDLAATLFWRFGLEPKTEVRDLAGRPYPLAEGQPLHSLFKI